MVDIGELAAVLEEVPSQGISVSQIERIKITCSLRLLQNQMKAESMYFLGKIFALHQDYYLAFSADVNNCVPSIYYCSQDAITWFSVTSVDPEARAEIIQLRSPLTGTLTSECILPSGRIINEEQRIAAILGDISENCLLVPRGFLIRTALDYVLRNPLWEGIPIEKCRKMSNFRHWKVRSVDLTPLEKSLGNPAVDFVEPLSDLSEWSFVFANEDIHFKSLRWPGFEFSLKDNTFANLYFGYGLGETNVGEIISNVSAPSQRHKCIR
jgi:radial spoke head protein 9